MPQDHEFSSEISSGFSAAPVEAAQAAPAAAARADGEAAASKSQGAAKGGTGRPVGLLLQYLLDSAAVGKAAKPKGNPKDKPKAKAQ